ncbi:TetR/AcrR family transcriptional regulator [Antrihabitans sp. YC3-6]|uniref:TetR/AcrR family transcriptional regulator n=1 Tax=Antrihabitans stalagmiti TaxID=2799499 RepID=A0A934NMJ6_9NOCA|nr:TetR/AcrR family transcriptional regulator [Antrihabitans stalagmiti]MBJ8337882.1 TetR/AcrR family transcriptional regulator [Antrihabitans stalagmiti]
MAADTRTRIVAATCELFRRQGMAGTGLKQIAQTANAPFGSIYHFFPGGKAELTEEVIRSWGVMYRNLVVTVFQSCPDLPTAIEASFAGAAESLALTDYADGCPVATVALEVASTDETLRIATADVFTDWVDVGSDLIAYTGLPPDVRRRLMIGFISSLEGAFVLSRSLRSKEPLEAAGHMVLQSALATLAEHAARAG